MKNNIYIFSNSVLSRKNDSFSVYEMSEAEAQCQVDFYEGETEVVLLPAKKLDTESKPKHIPAESVEAFYTFGEVRFNTQFLKCASSYEIPVHVFNFYGNYVGSFIPANSQSGDIQILQYEAYLIYHKRLYIAKSILEAAVKNILANLKSYQYSGIELSDSINEISAILEQMHFSETISELMGYEGSARTVYYKSWNEIIKQDTDFNKRIKNPPIGMINSLISFGNSILYGVCLSEIYRTRLNPFIGFIHEVGDNKQPLVYDISEVFKPVIVDKVIFRVINLNIISEDDFESTEKGFYLKDEPRKKFVKELEDRLSTVINHKRLNRRVSYRSLIRMECFNLINYLNGKLISYEPYRAG